jgi:hypothetical protein
VSLTALTGWVLTALFLTTITIPYLSRVSGNPRLSEAFALRMRTHFSLGFGIAAISLLHAAIAITTPMPGGQRYLSGIGIATVGLFLGFGQVAIGARLRGRPALARRRLRYLHLGIMLLLAGAGLAHVLLNGSLIRALLGLSGSA